MNSSKEFIGKYCQLTNQIFDYQIKETQGLPFESFEIRNSELLFSDVNGLRNGINLFNRISRENTDVPKGIVGPSFKIRGVIEGFYGKPWTHENRIKGMALFAEKNMNTFILAPKDDPWQRFDWRTPFGDEFLSKTRELVQLGKDLLIDVSICVSPGLTVTYSSRDDIAALLVRYQQLMEIGVTRFGLLLDDIPGELQFEEDKREFKDIAQAHAGFANAINRLVRSTSKEFSLFVCPLQYHGRGNEYYITNLGKSLDAEIDLMWTGRQICSEYLDEIDAEMFCNETTKRPFYWDNYPVNDVAMIHQLHVGPLEKRESKLGSLAQGLVANPMDLFEASLLPLITVADYLWESENYNPEYSWEQGVIRLFKVTQEREAVRHLFRNCFESCLAVDSAPDFGKILGRATLAWRTGENRVAAEILRECGEDIIQSHKILQDENFSLPSLRVEIAPWLKKYFEVGLALLNVSKILDSASFKDGRIWGLPKTADEVRKIRISLAQNPTRIFGDGLDLVLGELATELTVA